VVPPQLDGDLDNGIIAHEYGHGISNRLTGGAGNSSCLGNAEQMGEGWSDWLGLMLTMKTGDTGLSGKGIGTYALGQSPSGNGIRQYKYSTSLTVNPHTYNSVKTVVAPHGVGSVWCAMLWEFTWNLIDLYGFDPDLYNGTGGNNIAMALVLEGMKLQPCSPGFVDARDAILLADMMLYNGDHQCLIWRAFAKRGLGFGATQGSSNSRTDGTESFLLSPTCYLDPRLTADKSTVIEGEQITFRIRIRNGNDAIVSNVVVTDTIPNGTSFVSATNGGTFDGYKVSFPGVSIAVGDSIVRYFTVLIPNTSSGGLYALADGAEANLTDNWKQNSTVPATGIWNKVTSNPRSGANCYYANDASTANELFLTVRPLRRLRSNSELSFWHYYNTEVGYDGGRVQISTDDGLTWVDLGSLFTLNGYNGILDDNPSTPGFTGLSGMYIQSKINLSAYAGMNILIRFWMHCDQSVGTTDGWRIDDIAFNNLQAIIDNTAKVASSLSSNLDVRLVAPVVFNNCSVVTNTDDLGEGSLRYAYDCVENGDTIRFGNNLNQDILLTSTFRVDKDIVIDNVLQSNVAIKNSSAQPTFTVLPAVSLSLRNVTVNAGLGNVGRAIMNQGALECFNVTIVDPLAISSPESTVLNLGTITYLGNNVIKL
jgi:extracellular elastinolytic metalloproteinase